MKIRFACAALAASLACAGVAVHDSVTPVPEAETYALALAGLSVVGLAVARRRKV